MSPPSTDGQNWFQIYEREFNKQISHPLFWEQDLKAEIPDLKHDETIAAIRSLGRDKAEGRRDFPPTVSEIANQVKHLRRKDEARQRNKVITGVEGGSNPVDTIKTAIRAAGDAEKAWAIICDPEKEIGVGASIDVDTCRYLERWARDEMGFDFAPIRAEMAKRMAEFRNKTRRIK